MDGIAVCSLPRMGRRFVGVLDAQLLLVCYIKNSFDGINTLGCVKDGGVKTLSFVEELPCCLL